MPLYHFCIRNGRYSGASEPEIELAEQDAACAEMTKVCGGLVGSIPAISTKMLNGSSWDESEKPAFRNAS
jgi:hypothetical protein